MKKLACDICGGMLEMQAGGEKCVCSCCGMSYATERVKEIYSGMKVSVTGSDDDVKQWKTLAAMYIESLDFQSAIPVVRKILEAVPDDTYAKEMYDYLQESQYFEIKDRVLIKYTGCAKCVKIPKGVREIKRSALHGDQIEEVIFPNGINSCQMGVFESDGYHYENFNMRKISFSNNCNNISNEVMGYDDRYIHDDCEGGTYVNGRQHCTEITLPEDYEGNIEWLIGFTKLEKINLNNNKIEELITIYSELWKKRREYNKKSYSDCKIQIKASPWLERELRKRNYCTKCGFNKSVSLIFGNRCKRCGAKIE